MKIAVLGAVDSRNYRATVNCLEQLGYTAITVRSLDTSAVEMLKECPYIIVQGHSSNYALYLYLRWKYQGVIINYWQGSDVFNTFHSPRRYARIKIAQLFVDRNWVVAERLRIELQKLGIKAYWIPQIIYPGRKEDIKEHKRAVLTYFPLVSGRNDQPSFVLHNIDKALNLASMMPDFTFYFVGGGSSNVNLANTEFLGDMPKLDAVWAMVDYYFRVTKSDGMPKMLLEALENNVLPISGYPYFENLWLYTDPRHIAERMRDYTKYDSDLDQLDKEVRQKHGYDQVKRIYEAQFHRL